MKMQQLMTNKLFYKKYPIKVEFRLNGNHYIRTHGANEIQNWPPARLRNPRYRFDPSPNPLSVIEFAKAFAQIESKIPKLRSEGQTFSVFFSDRETLDQIKKSMQKWITKIYAPENEDQFKFFETHNANKVLCKELPYKKFKYKISLTTNVPSNIRERFDQWSTNYGSDLGISKSTQSWLEGTNRYCYHPFIYVTDSKLLSMILLYLGNNIKTVEEYIVKDNINT